jgi:hypothetical protein
MKIVDTTAARTVGRDAGSYTAALNYTYGPIKVGHQQGWLENWIKIGSSW